MNHDAYRLHQLFEAITPPETGKQSRVLWEDARIKGVLFAFAAGAGLAEHVAPCPVVIQILGGEATLTVRGETLAGKPGTWLHLEPRTPHGLQALTPLVMLLTLLK
ncbi:MAG: cupin domain-containing protein [Planctomycetaceae bacterium]|nr:cupin domain-containing protein [Planctomycetaceae bacterium]